MYLNLSICLFFENIQDLKTSLPIWNNDILSKRRLLSS